ncbi:Epoxide hydrolase-like protein [Moelleriella libera RCEF 2490]|uniref:Epoxide hydrolase-like protein n=1 Tax=Moelleriella libera RCEF 2490 TaxID=1081109 RepID=A0A166PUM0_9HYPO|nr:Epoxide hydrolase-like protein [Moelleriella libera RCEF 2490]
MPVRSPRRIDDSRWISSRANLSETRSWPDEVTIRYIDCPAPSDAAEGTILLIHGFPETSYQFRHVITPLSDAGFRVIAPDYRGASHSSHPRDGYTKSVMAQDLHTLLLDHLRITGPVHVVGQDIGGMVAHAYASRFPKDTRSVYVQISPVSQQVHGLQNLTLEMKHLGESAHSLEQKHTRTLSTVQEFGTLRSTGSLFRKLSWRAGSRIYLEHFYDRPSLNPGAIYPADLDHYATMFARPARCHEEPALMCTELSTLMPKRIASSCVRESPCSVPAQALNGKGSFLAEIAESMVDEMYRDWSAATVEGSGHWCAEENPEDFVKRVLTFVRKH